MTFLAPGLFALACAVAAGIVGLHFLVTRQPPSAPLPTARFVPTARVEVVTLARRPEDLFLLLLRVLLVLLVGAAFARPVWVPGHRDVARVILADLSRSSVNIGQVRDSARTLAHSGDVVIGFDSVARRLQSLTGDWSTYALAGDRTGRLSTALIAGMRAAADLRASADSVELVLISPLAAEEWDAATGSIRAQWPGRIRLVRVAGRNDSLGLGSGVTVRGSSDDPIAVAVAAAGIAAGDSGVRIVRDSARASDSIWATERGTLVRWYAKAVPSGWVARPRADTSGAILAGDVALVFPFERRWRLDSTSGSRSVVARWVDGEPAAVERRLPHGCIRDVAIPVPTRGDLVLRPEFSRFLGQLVRPCGADRGDQPINPEMISLLQGNGPLASQATLSAPERTIPPIVPWLLGAALLLSLLEPLIRHRLSDVRREAT